MDHAGHWRTHTHTHTHTHTPINKTKTVKKKKKYNRLTQQTKGMKNNINQLKTKLTKEQTGKQNQSRCQLGNKAKKTKTNQHRVKKKEKEKKKD